MLRKVLDGLLLESLERVLVREERQRKRVATLLRAKDDFTAARWPTAQHDAPKAYDEIANRIGRENLPLLAAAIQAERTRPPPRQTRRKEAAETDSMMTARGGLASD
jgi:hypothetical protein